MDLCRRLYPQKRTNNPRENPFRPFVIDRKNWLFSDTVTGAKASANHYSLIETAKDCGIEPYDYLRELFVRLPTAETAGDNGGCKSAAG